MPSRTIASGIAALTCVAAFGRCPAGDAERAGAPVQAQGASTGIGSLYVGKVKYKLSAPTACGDAPPAGGDLFNLVLYVGSGSSASDEDLKDGDRISFVLEGKAPSSAVTRNGDAVVNGAVAIGDASGADADDYLELVAAEGGKLSTSAGDTIGGFSGSAKYTPIRQGEQAGKLTVKLERGSAGGMPIAPADAAECGSRRDKTGEDLPIGVTMVVFRGGSALSAGASKSFGIAWKGRKDGTVRTVGKSARGTATNHSLTHDGLKRTYRRYLPPEFTRDRSWPLVIALHGGLGTGEAMERLTEKGFNRLADREGFVVVYPNGIEKHWNDGRREVTYRAHKDNVDDVGFVSALIDRLASDVNIDLGKVYCTGMSNGALMSHRLAAELSDKIAAIAPVGGSIPKDIVEDCNPPRAMPVLIVSGTDDPLVPWEGGDIRGGLFGTRSAGKVVSTPDAVSHWATHNQCLPTPEVTWLDDRRPDDGTRVRREVYGGGRDGSEVVLCAVEGGGHTWPGGWQYLSEKLVGRTCRDMDACGVIWEFFKRHGRAAASMRSGKAAR